MDILTITMAIIILIINHLNFKTIMKKEVSNKIIFFVIKYVVPFVLGLLGGANSDTIIDCLS